MSNKPAFLVTADWHVRRGDRVWGRRETLCGDTAYGIQQVQEIALRRGVKHILLLGDVTEEPSQYSDAVELLRRTMDSLERNRVEVSFVQGQHEKSPLPVLSAIHDWPVHIHKKLVETPAGMLYGLDYEPPTRVQQTLQDISSEATVLATHQVWRQWMGDTLGFANVEDVPKNVRLVLSGDYHQQRADEHDSRIMVSPGPLVAQDLSQLGPKGVWIVYDDMSAEAVILKTRPFYKLRVDSEADLKTLFDGWSDDPRRMPALDVPSQVATPIVCIKYATNIPEVRHQLESRLGSSVHLFLEPFTPALAQETSIEATEREKAVLGGGMPGCLAAFYRQNEEVYQTAMRLWQAKNILEEARSVVQERTASQEK